MKGCRNFRTKVPSLSGYPAGRWYGWRDSNPDPLFRRHVSLSAVASNLGRVSVDQIGRLLTDIVPGFAHPKGSISRADVVTDGYVDQLGP